MVLLMLLFSVRRFFDPRKTTTSFSFTCLGKAFQIIISIWICFRLYISISIRIWPPPNPPLALPFFSLVIEPPEASRLLKFEILRNSYPFLTISFGKFFSIYYSISGLQLPWHRVRVNSCWSAGSSKIPLHFSCTNYFLLVLALTSHFSIFSFY